MQTNEISGGYSDLLRQFKDRTGTTTAVKNLRILFYFEGDSFDLVALEESTGFCMVVAIYSKKGWRHKLLPGSPARKIIEEICDSEDVEDAPAAINFRLDLYGR